MSGDSEFAAEITGEFHRSKGDDLKWHAEWLEQRLEEMLSDFDPEIFIRNIEFVENSTEGDNQSK